MQEANIVDTTEVERGSLTILLRRAKLVITIRSIIVDCLNGKTADCESVYNGLPKSTKRIPTVLISKLRTFLKKKDAVAAPTADVD